MDYSKLFARSLVSLLCACAVVACQDSPAEPTPTTTASSRPAGTAKPRAEANRYQVPVDQAPFRGGQDALVTIVQFTHYQCRFSAKGQPTLHKLLEEYGEQLKLVVRYGPSRLSEEDQLAAEAALAAFHQDHFGEMHDKLFANPKALSREDLDGYAKEIGLDTAKFAEALDSHEYRDAVEADKGLAKRFGVTRTPMFFVNGVVVRGAQPYAVFRRKIDSAIEDAEARLAEGAEKANLYAELTKDGLRQAKTSRTKATAAKRKKPEPNVVYRVPLHDYNPTKGAEDPLVVVVEYSDFECPYCGRVGPTIEKLMAEYEGKIARVWKHNPLPFHRHAMGAAEASMAAHEQGEFWAAHDKLFEESKHLSLEDMEGYAQELDLDMARYRSAMEEHKFQKQILADHEEATRLGSTGTPGFFINGRYLSGAQAYPVFKALVDAELEKAEKLLKDGVARSEVYSHIMKDAQEGP